MDAFTKFVWIYPTKILNTKGVSDKLRLQQETFGNPRKKIVDKIGASIEMTDWGLENNLERIQTTTGLPRGNGQVESFRQVILNVLSMKIQISVIRITELVKYECLKQNEMIFEKELTVSNFTK